jgi:hypothetical protein
MATILESSSRSRLTMGLTIGFAPIGLSWRISRGMCLCLGHYSVPLPQVATRGYLLYT